MKNFEKYEKEIKEIIEEGRDIAVNAEGKPCVCKSDCDKCKLEVKRSCANGLLCWLYEEYKETPVLNVDERRFCKALKHGWIARGRSGNMAHVYKDKPVRMESEDGFVWWHSTSENAIIDVNNVVEDCYEVPLDINENLKFDFIKEDDEEPWSIEALLELDCDEYKANQCDINKKGRFIMKVFLVERPATEYIQDYAMVIIAEDALHAERKARLESRDFKKCDEITVTEISTDKEQCVLIANTGA